MIKLLAFSITLLAGMSAPAFAAGGGDAGGVEIQKLDPVTVSLHLSEGEPCGFKRLFMELALSGKGATLHSGLKPLFNDRINQHLSGMSYAETKQKGFAVKLKEDLLEIVNEVIEPEHVDEVLINKLIVQ